MKVEYGVRGKLCIQQIPVKCSWMRAGSGGGGRNNNCVLVSLPGNNTMYYIYLIVRFVLKEEKTPKFESVCDKAEIWGFWFLAWWHSCLFGSIRLFQTFFKAWNSIRGLGKVTQDFLKISMQGRENKWQRGTSLFVPRIWPCTYYTTCVHLDCHMSCFQNYLHITVNSLIFLRLPVRCLVCKQAVGQDPREQAFPSLRKSPWPEWDWGH